MRHAYLILAHHEFAVLEQLVAALDDFRNDIYIHFDFKVQEIPQIKTDNAGLFIIDHRIDVHWGDVSVVEAEYCLFEAAQKTGAYGYYHLLSGVDMPLKSQDTIHDFFALHNGKEFIGYSQGDQTEQIERKVQRYHLFPKHFRAKGNMSGLFCRMVRFFVLRMQFVMGIKRNQQVHFKKGTQWVSLTSKFVSYLLHQKTTILKRYQYTFCADEIFVQTVCWNSEFRSGIYNADAEGEGSQRLIHWKDNWICDWEEQDYGQLMDSGHMFARKFSSRHNEIVKKILEQVTHR